MTNFLQETLNILSYNDKKPENIVWIGSGDGKYSVSWAEFIKFANIEYDSGYGGQEIISDIVIVGNDWWMSRGEYDGSEWWNFNTIPVRDVNPKPFSKLTGEYGWSSIEDLENPEDDFYSDDEDID